MGFATKVFGNDHPWCPSSGSTRIILSHYRLSLHMVATASCSTFVNVNIMSFVTVAFALFALQMAWCYSTYSVTDD